MRTCLDTLLLAAMLTLLYGTLRSTLGDSLLLTGIMLLSCLTGGILRISIILGVNRTLRPRLGHASLLAGVRLLPHGSLRTRLRPALLHMGLRILRIHIPALRVLTVCWALILLHNLQTIPLI